MGILTRAFERAPDRRAKVLGDQVLDWLMGSTSSSGVSVTHDNALTISAVFACVRVLSETLAALPLHLYERQADGGKRKATGHPLYNVLHSVANPEMSSYKVRETLQSHVATWGNGYAELEIGNAGEVLALWPLRPDRTEPMRLGGDLVYKTQLADSQGAQHVYIPAERVFHVYGLGFDGLQGYSPVRLFREGLGLSLATERYGATFFGNGARPGMVLKHPGVLKDEGRKNLRESWVSVHGGLDNANRIAILEEGMDVETIGLPPEEAQFLSTRKFQVNEIARIYRVPPHMIADLERATFSNIEHQSIDFVTFTMSPWLFNWEQEIERQLLLPKERARFYPKFLTAGLLRGDTISRYQAYAVARQNGWMSANDVRQLEEMDPIAGGDVYLVPLNMVPAGEVGAGSSEEGQARGLAPTMDENGQARGLAPTMDETERRAAAGGVARHRLIGAWRPLYAEAAGRLVRRETNDVLNQARKFEKAGDVGGFLLWLDEFYREFAGVVAGELRPVNWGYGDLVAAAVDRELYELYEGQRAGTGTRPYEGRQEEGAAPWEPFAQRYTEAAASRHVAKSKDRITEIVRRAIADGEPWIVALQEEFDQQREARPAQIADREAVQFNSALAVSLYSSFGVRRIRWVAIGESCPYCRSLNGRIVGIEGSFLGAGDFQPPGVDKPLTVKRRVGHAPAHGGCDCITMAAI